jgi:predicted NBD/HSP70 family sugar kinase
MERYIGLDVHAESTTLVVVSQTGRTLRQEVVETNGAALRQALLRAIPGPKRLCLEEVATGHGCCLERERTARRRWP